MIGRLFTFCSVYFLTILGYILCFALAKLDGCYLNSNILGYLNGHFLDSGSTEPIRHGRSDGGRTSAHHYSLLRGMTSASFSIHLFVQRFCVRLVLMRRPFCQKGLLADLYPRGCQKGWFYFTTDNSTYNNSKVYLNYAVVPNYVVSRMFVNHYSHLHLMMSASSIPGSLMSLMNNLILVLLVLTDESFLLRDRLSSYLVTHSPLIICFLYIKAKALIRKCALVQAFIGALISLVAYRQVLIRALISQVASGSYAAFCSLCDISVDQVLHVPYRSGDLNRLTTFRSFGCCSSHTAQEI